MKYIKRISVLYFNKKKKHESLESLCLLTKNTRFLFLFVNTSCFYTKNVRLSLLQNILSFLWIENGGEKFV